MNTGLVKWTHWFEAVPALGVKCIAIKRSKNFLWDITKIFTEEGEVYWVKSKRIIERYVNTPITVQPKEDIIEILNQSKFGRPSRVQKAIERCISEIESK